MGVTRRSRGSRSTAAAVVVILCAGMLVLTAAPASAATVIVNQNHEHGWSMQHDVCQGSEENTGEMNFVAGPQGVPGPEGDQEEPPGQDTPDGDTPNGGPPGPSSGSLEYRIGENGWSIEYFRNVNYDGVALDDIQAMNYWTYEDPSSAENSGGLPFGYVPAVYIRLIIDTDGSGNGPTDALVFEPAYQETDAQHDVDPAAWQKWIADDSDDSPPEGKWWLESVGADVSTMKSLDEWTPNSGPEWTIVNEDGYGGVILGAGCGEPEPWSDFIGNTDRFTIDVQGPG